MHFAYNMKENLYNIRAECYGVVFIKTKSYLSIL